jgi:hypothetical protein
MKTFNLIGIFYLVINSFVVIKAQDGIPFLSILSPSNIVNLYEHDVDFRKANGWGSSVPGGNLIAPAKIPDGELTLCVDDQTDFTGKIAIIMRGTCEFSAKALVAQNKGAIAVIIVNFENALVTMGPGASGNLIHIPVIFMLKDQGEVIINALKDKQEVILSMGNSAQGFGIVNGFIRNDLNGDCIADTTDPGLSGYKLQIKDKSGFTFNIQSGVDGYYKRFLHPGNGPYQLSVFSPHSAWSPCDLYKEAQVSANDTVDLNFAVQKNRDCIELHTNISAPRLRRCFNAEFIVQVCNEGTIVSNQSYVDVGLAKEFGPISGATTNYSLIGSNIYRFQLDDIGMFECKTVNFYAEVLCDSTQLGQTLCYYAQAYPDTTCKDLSLDWRGADIKIHGQCLGNRVEFIIKNEGTGDMNTPGNYIIAEDDQLYKDSIFYLLAGQSKTIVLPANGSTWHIEATQDPNHPFPSKLSKTVEACSVNNNFTTGFAMMYPVTEGNYSYDEECQEVRGSFDPNDKAGYPYGFGPFNLIKADAELEYFIRFQNTGTDTAFTVSVQDELNAALDPSTINSVVSSHDYTMELKSKNLLVFKFDKINLVDSFTNEPGSHGFVSFKIKQKPGNPDGTFIENIANIYFDFNSPIWTNSVYHEVGEFIGVKVATKNTQTFESIHVYPNPGNVGSDFQLTTNEFDNSNWSLVNDIGQKLCEGKVVGKTIKLPATLQHKGFYILEIQSRAKGKIIKKVILN